jgi:indole-3-glycerol phosphate synthase
MTRANKMLESFRRAKQAEIDALLGQERQGRLPEPWTGQRPSFARALRMPGLSVIAEYKRASPSKGVINASLEPEDVAAAYAEGGAAALSVLTEADHFQGDLDFLRRMATPGLPMLRKDFTLHPLQVAQTAATPASALLLIVRMLEPGLLQDLLLGAQRLGLDAVVEVFDAEDLRRAQELEAEGVRIIQVNNRDLDTLRTDLAVSETLIRHKRDDEIWISASGIATAGDLRRMEQLSFDAALIGTFLMQTNAPGAALADLLRGARP